MTPQERTMLSDLIDRVNGTQLTERDPEATQLLQQKLSSNPDALYVLTQTVLVQNYALGQAKAQIDQMKRQPVPQQQHEPGTVTSFLGNFFGRHDDTEKHQAPPTQRYQPQSNYPPPQQPNYAPQGSYAAPPVAGGGPSFLRSAATTAAGVAAGALAFQGVESLMHGFGREAGFGGGGFMGGGAGYPGGETVVNNYYDGTGQGGDAQGFGDGDVHPDDRTADERLQDAQLTSQQDESNLSPQLDQANDVNVTGDDMQDASLDPSSYDDSGSFDSGGGFDGGDDSSLS